MASTTSSPAPAALFLALSLLLSSTATSCSTCQPAVPTPPPAVNCPRDTLKLGVCVDLLGLINLSLGKPPKSPCCALLDGLANLEAAVCLCTALKANLLGIQLNLPVNLSLLLNYCGRDTPSGFQCA